MAASLSSVMRVPEFRTSSSRLKGGTSAACAQHHRSSCSADASVCMEKAGWLAGESSTRTLRGVVSQRGCAHGAGSSRGSRRSSASKWLRPPRRGGGGVSGAAGAATAAQVASKARLHGPHDTSSAGRELGRRIAGEALGGVLDNPTGASWPPSTPPLLPPLTVAALAGCCAWPRPEGPCGGGGPGRGGVQSRSGLFAKQRGAQLPGVVVGQHQLPEGAGGDGVA